MLDDLRQVQRDAHRMARDKGFYDDDDILEGNALTLRFPGDYEALRRRLVLARLAMIASEVGEAVDAVRKCDANHPAFRVTVPVRGEAHPPSEDPDFTAFHTRELVGTAHGEELADIVIRTLDLAAYMDIDLATEIEAKVARNAVRPDKHGKLA